MKTNIEVKDRREGDAIRTALEDPIVRASVLLVGILKPMTPRARKRVLDFVIDKLDEDEQEKKTAEGNGQTGA